MEGWNGAVNLDTRVANAGPVAGARPGPVGGFLDKSASDGVVVDVLDGVVDGGWIEEVFVPTGSGLPEAVIGAVGVDNGEFFQERGCVLLEVPDRLMTDGLLDRGEDLVGLHLRIGHPEEDMDVFGHDYPRPEMEAVSVAGALARVDEPQSRAVSGKELVAAVAGEGEKVRITCDIVVFDFLSVRGTGGHG